METLWIVLWACIMALAVVAWSPIWAWRLRKLPGPFRLPLLGHLPGILAKGNLTLWREDMGKRYGKVYQMWNGALPIVVVWDIDLTRKLLMGCTQRPSLEFFSVLTGENRALARSGLLSMSPATHGAKFRSLRKAFELAVLTPAALAAHAGMLCQNASRLVTYLSRYAVSGEPLDMTIPLSDMTMDAIGFAAFGLDLDCLGVANQAPAGPDDSAVTTTGNWTDAPPGSLEFSRGLVDASRTIFRSADITRSTRWRLPSMIMPSMFHVVRHLANWFPDRLMKIELKARGDLSKAVRVLISQWQRQKEAASAVNGTANGAAPLMAISDRGFLAKLLESAKAEGMTELEVVSQAFTMLLAGYETTAATLAASLHLLAQNPKAQARLQAELDDVLDGKLATTEDLERLPYLSGVIDESLRVYPPADAVRLLTPQDQDLDVGNGRIIPGGAFVLFDVNSMHHDPAIWPRASEFLPERFVQPGNEALAPSNPNALMPFGLGARMCPGYKFALMEGRITLARLLQAYTFKPAPGCPLPVWKTGIVYSADQVWLTISPRQET